MMKRKNLMISLADMELQSAEGDEWRINGYATKFGNTNSYGFEIAAGAYDTVLKAGVKPKMFFNHDAWSVPIGLWDRLEADEKGLRVEGVLTKGVSQAGDVYAALKAGTVDGLSVGISFNEEDAVLVGKRIILKNIRELREISVVTNPSDGKARISSVLSADEMDERIEGIQTVRDAEDFLRETVGLSKRQSGWLLSKVKASMASDTRRDDELEAQKELQAIFSRITHSEVNK